ncbi:MFS-type transporter SLC18B1-like [Aethina tumida]|uniref:MFS-type transporter SLC18B1-like n=1 Tax=Aethina tumida TaxID=116153 RepID=UPI00096B2229|nr:MFS-type transporter SLC18B1-like [Aethina tumida]XP_049821943.1 MFS-type transporter SLC18B1-like [Aethina tumida]XP_049821944.1 MFS-type transporter SLC18B1-like [Aethina tumida]
MEGESNEKDLGEKCNGEVEQGKTDVNSNDAKVDEKPKRFTIKQKVALVMLAAADFMCFCSMSIMAPFYPQEAANKGMTESMAGFVFGYYALVVFLTSPIFGKILPKLGVKFLFVTGLLTSGICSITFGTLHTIKDYNLFMILSFVIRGLEALGASAYSTAGYVIIINIFPDNASAVRGLLETFVGLGMSAGPAIGGLLFAIGGFSLPFYVVGLIITLLAPLNIYLLPTSEKCSLDVKTGSLLNLLKLPPVIFTCLIMVIVAMTWGFLDPTLEPHLRKFHLSPGNIGLIFLLLSATYGICSPAWGWLTDRIDNYWCLMPIGLFGNCLVLLLLGPSPLLSFMEDSIWLNIIALSCLGVFVAMSLMPTYQFLLDSALEGGFTENLGTHSVIAGLWSSVYSLGEVLGPILGGTLLENYNFPITSTTFSILNLVVASLATVYFVNIRTKVPTVAEKNHNLLKKKVEDLKISYTNDLCEVHGLERRVKNGHVPVEYKVE